MTGGAQNKLGELFVDIGVGGLGKTLKGLNSVSASFLLTKNAAIQAIKPFANIAKQAMSSAVGIGKMAAALGTTSLNAQKLSYYLNKYKSQGLEGDVASLQQTFTRLRAGYGGLDGQMAMSMGQLGLDWQNYSGSFEDTLRFVQDVKNAFKSSNLSKNEQLMHLQNLGLGGWQYLFEKEDFNLEDALRISDETISNLQKGDEAIEELGNNLDQLRKNLTNSALNKGGLKTIQDINKSFDGNKSAQARSLTRGASVVGGALTGGLVGSAGGPLGSIAGLIVGGAGALLGNEAILNKSGLNNLEAIPKTDSIYTNDIQNGALPNLANASGQPLQINVNTQIKSKDPQSTEFEILDIDVPDIQYVQTQQRSQTGN